MSISFIRKKVHRKEYDLSMHAHNERQEEQITLKEIKKVLLKSAIIEEYPNDPRGASCLVAGLVSGHPLHVVCGMRGDRLLVVTVYRPKQPIWIDYKTRGKELRSRE